MAVETQTYLDETKTPSLKTLIQARDDVKTYVPEIGEFQQQLTVWTAMAEEALITETEEGIKEYLKQGLEFCSDLLQRINSARLIQRRMIDVGIELNRVDTELREHIVNEGLGYTV